MRAGHRQSIRVIRLEKPGSYGGDYVRYRRRRRSVSKGPVVAAAAGLLSIAVVAAAVVAAGNHASARSAASTAAANMNCTLIVPASPLTAQGLATPYQLTATNPADGPCNEANPNQTAFVQGTVIDPATGQISVYNPLVVDAGTQPAVTPVAPVLPAGAVVGIWFGFNGGTLSFEGADQAGLTAATATAPATATPRLPPHRRLPRRRRRPLAAPRPRQRYRPRSRRATTITAVRRLRRPHRPRRPPPPPRRPPRRRRSRPERPPPP